ncbi:MAG: hypothetical protein QM765_36750 [Myxococcales bacterium]
MTPYEPQSTFGIALRVARALESVGAAYFLGGSLASSIQGDPRATNDIDFVVQLSPSSVPALARALGPDFEVDEVSLAEAVRRHGSWNVFFLPQFVKVDLFQCGAGEFDQSEFSRRSKFEIRSGEFLYLKSPEDSVLRKLLWYRQGGEVASHQWRDVVEVLRVNAATLETGYLEEWAAKLGLENLLQRAIDEARGPKR